MNLELNKVLKQSRFRLGDYLDKPAQYYHATFGFVTHKKSGRAVVLLRDLYFVDQAGRKIALRKSNDQIDKYGRHIVADHLWVNLTKPWLKLGLELLDGDEVMFKASVTPYKITRKDTLDKRNQIWNKALVKNELLYEHYRMLKIKRKTPKQALEKMQAKQKANLAKAKKEEDGIALVDYTLNKIKDLCVVRRKRVYYGVKRLAYDAGRIKDHAYTKYLAWHSMDYAEKRGDYQTNKKKAE